jgi:hypothetical protein
MRNMAVLLGALLIFGCAGTTGGEKKSSIDPVVQAAIDEAIAANENANSVGYEWRDAGRFIKEAQAAAEAGDNDTAMALANKAKTQGDLAYQQALSQKNAGPRF